MDAEQIRGLKPMLTRFLNRFDDCFARGDYPGAPVGLRGRTIVEPGAQERGADRLGGRRAGANAARVPQPASLAGGSGTRPFAADRRQGTCPSAFRRHHRRNQFCEAGQKDSGRSTTIPGTVGKRENGVVTVHLAYAADDFTACWTANCSCRRVGHKTPNAVARRRFPRR